MNELILSDHFALSFRRWWWIVLAMLVGGGLGWGYHRIQPPVYEAKAVFVVSIDFSRADAVPHWDQDRYEEDLMIGAVKSLMIATDVLGGLATDLTERGIASDVLVYNKTIFVERKQNEMVIRVRHTDPAIAAQIANLWAERAHAALQEAYAQSLRAQTLRITIESLKTCTQEPTTKSELCQAATLPELDQKLLDLENQLNAATQASRAISPTIVFDYSQQAEPPLQPVLFESNRLVLAGALIGFILGIMLAMGWKR